MRRSLLVTAGVAAFISGVVVIAWASSPGEKLPAPPFERSPAGGSNSPEPSDPLPFVLKLAEIGGEGFRIRVPTGTYTAPEGGAPAYRVPGPIASFKGPDGQWRGRGYLETYPRLMKFSGKKVDVADAADGTRSSATLKYTFEGGKTYEVKLAVKADHVLLEETSDLGPRNMYVFDAFPNWQPTSGFAVGLAGQTHAFRYLPCFYDKPEATVNPTAEQARRVGTDAKETDPVPGGVAVVSADAESKDVAGFWCRDVGSWRQGEAMGFQLWQRRQLPGEPASRHFLGPETKSDSTPNPRTAGMLGKSLYEGHVTIELNLGVGSRKLGFTATRKGEGDKLPDPFKKLVAATLKEGE
ncbi:MAG: hypothetical protein ACOCZU_08130 [Planctomycetota bacterium]